MVTKRALKAFDIRKDKNQNHHDGHRCRWATGRLVSKQNGSFSSLSTNVHILLSTSTSYLACLPFIHETHVLEWPCLSCPSRLCSRLAPSYRCATKGRNTRIGKNKSNQPHAPFAWRLFQFFQLLFLTAQSRHTAPEPNCSPKQPTPT